MTGKLLVAALAVAPLWAQPIRVKLSVRADQNFEAELRSYLHRELRSLADVSVVQEAPDYYLEIVAGRSDSVQGVGAYALSCVALRSLPLELVGHALLIQDSRKFLGEAARAVVATFDADVLEPERQDRQRRNPRLTPPVPASPGSSPGSSTTGSSARPAHPSPR